MTLTIHGVRTQPAYDDGEPGPSDAGVSEVRDFFSSSYFLIRAPRVPTAPIHAAHTDLSRREHGRLHCIMADFIVS